VRKRRPAADSFLRVYRAFVGSIYNIIETKYYIVWFSTKPLLAF
jgi:hypothetical protein